MRPITGSAEPSAVARVPSPRMAVLLNVNAKRVTGSLVRALQRTIGPEAVLVSHSLEEAEAHCASVLDRRIELLAVGGGDGSVTHALNLLERLSQEKGVPIPTVGVLKLGTGNALGYLTGAGHVLDDIKAWMRRGFGPTRSLSLVEDMEEGFRFPFASVGYDARVLNDYEALVGSTRHPLGRVVMRSVWGYVVAAFTRTIPTELAARPIRFKVRATGGASAIDPRTDEERPLPDGSVLFDGMARSVTLGSSPFYGYGIPALPFARRRHDRFQVRVSTATPLQMVARFPALWRGTLRTELFQDFLVSGVEVELAEHLPFQMAGEAAGQRRHFHWELSKSTFQLASGSRAPLSTGLLARAR
ncbi:MAG: diacylglycerol kinase family protein [Myxococcota bacterium]